MAWASTRAYRINMIERTGSEPLAVAAGSCGSGFWGGQPPTLAHYVPGMGPPWTERPLPEGVRVAYPRTKIIVATPSALENC